MQIAGSDLDPQPLCGRVVLEKGLRVFEFAGAPHRIAVIPRQMLFIRPDAELAHITVMRETGIEHTMVRRDPFRPGFPPTHGTHNELFSCVRPDGCKVNAVVRIHFSAVEQGIDIATRLMAATFPGSSGRSGFALLTGKHFSRP